MWKPSHCGCLVPPLAQSFLDSGQKTQLQADDGGHVGIEEKEPASESDSLTRIMCKYVVNVSRPVPQAKYLHEALAGPHRHLELQGQCWECLVATKFPEFHLIQEPKGLP